VLVSANHLDAIDGACVAVVREPRSVGPVQVEHFLKGVVDDTRQMRRCHRGLSVADSSGIYDDD